MRKLKIFLSKLDYIYIILCSLHNFKNRYLKLKVQRQRVHNVLYLKQTANTNSILWFDFTIHLKSSNPIYPIHSSSSSSPSSPDKLRLFPFHPTSFLSFPSARPSHRGCEIATSWPLQQERGVRSLPSSQVYTPKVILKLEKVVLTKHKSVHRGHVGIKFWVRILENYIAVHRSNFRLENTGPDLHFARATS